MRDKNQNKPLEADGCLAAPAVFKRLKGATVYRLAVVAGGGRADTADVVDETDGKLALQMAQPP